MNLGFLKSKLVKMLESKLMSELAGVSFEFKILNLTNTKWSPPTIVQRESKLIAVYAKREKMVLQSINHTLKDVIEPKLSKSCIGGVRGKSFADWLKFLDEARKEKLYWVVKTDIKDFFYSIDHSILDRILSRRFRVAKDFRTVLFSILKLSETGYITKGIYPGNPCGKLLGNIYLSPLDNKLTEMGLLYVRFIDDILVFCKTQTQAEKTLEFIAQFVKTELSLELSSEKTGIYHLFFDRFDFLGFSVVGMNVGPTNENIERFVKKVESLPDEYRKKGIKKFLKKLNSYVYHFGHLYKRGNVLKLYSKLDEVIRSSVRRYLKLSGKGINFSDNYLNPLKFPVNLAFSNDLVKKIGVVSLVDIKRRFDQRITDKQTGLKCTDVNKIINNRSVYSVVGMREQNFFSSFVITNQGNVGIGTAKPSAKLQVGVSGDGSYAIANAWNTFSSIRWKTNIKPIEKALEKVERLKGVYFDWKKTGRHDMGMIAEEVGKVIPEVVEYEENGVDAKSLDYSRLVALLIEAIKEQQKQIEELNKKLESLNNKK